MKKMEKMEKRSAFFSTFPVLRWYVGTDADYFNKNRWLGVYQQLFFMLVRVGTLVQQKRERSVRFTRAERSGKAYR